MTATLDLQSLAAKICHEAAELDNDPVELRRAYRALDLHEQELKADLTAVRRMKATIGAKIFTTSAAAEAALPSNAVTTSHNGPTDY